MKTKIANVCCTEIGVADSGTYVEIRLGDDEDAPSHIHTATEVEQIIAALMEACAEIKKAQEKIVAADIKDGATFRVDGEWRKVLAVHPGRFIVVDRYGGMQFEMKSATKLADEMNYLGYKRSDE